MASALIDAGHDVRLLTSLPKSRFPGLRPEAITSLIFPEIFYRAVRKVGAERFADETKMRWFGWQVAKRIRPDVDIVVAWSSFALESFRATKAKKVLVRDSAHISYQMAVLKEEFASYGLPFEEEPLAKVRELAEYQVSDHLLVLSEFARRTFLDRGFPQGKISKVTLGTDLAKFRPDGHAHQKPLRVVYFGAMSLQKGVQYLLQAFANVPPERAVLQLVGAFAPEFRAILKGFPGVRVHPPMNHDDLSEFVRKQDVFVFPTLHDGFGLTLLQAMSSGLVPIVSHNCGAAELVRDGENGFVIPIRSVGSISDGIARLASDPQLLAQMRSNAVSSVARYDWDAYSDQICQFVRAIADR